MSLLTEIKLKDNCGRLRTDDKVSEGVGMQHRHIELFYIEASDNPAWYDLAYDNSDILFLLTPVHEHQYSCHSCWIPSFY